MKPLFVAFFTLVGICWGQDPYPKDYFTSPLDIPLILSGSFAELRANHFHSGLDIKTQQRQGLNVYASAEGFVNRIKISHGGYGKALYVTHPNGYTTVYAHLQKFSPRIEAYIKQHQYGQETFEIEVFPGAVELPVTKGELIAYSGNTGGSEGPHLHYEIRDNEERPLNPLLFGLDVKDTTKPQYKAVYAYPLSEDAHINKSDAVQKLRLIPLKNGDFQVEPISAYGKIGIGIVANDKQDLAYNQNGLFNIRSIFNGVTNFEINFSRFSFDETMHLNRYIDYGFYKTEKERIQKLFVEKGNNLSLIKEVVDAGVLTITDSTSSVYKVRIKDIHDNDSWLSLTIKGLKTSDIKKVEEFESDRYVTADQNTTLSDGNVTVFIPSGTFYDDFYADFKVKSDTLFFNEDVHPMLKSMSITYDVSHYAEADRNQLYIAELAGYYKRPYYTNTKLQGNKLIATTKYLGTYTIVQDAVPPSISPLNFSNNKWVSTLSELQLKIEDKESGISNYRATVNGKWILMEYDYKKKTLTYDFNDGITTDTENKLKVIVTDNVGNSSTFEATFFRK